MEISRVANWKVQQLVKVGLYPSEGVVIDNALRALFQLEPEAKEKVIINAYDDGDISLGKAAELLGVCQEEAKEILHRSGFELQLGPSTIKEAKMEVEALGDF
ncbi:MAG: UPF0175 family protein [bacterium]|nr:UPF0175 family protein [bacterium]